MVSADDPDAQDQVLTVPFEVGDKGAPEYCIPVGPTEKTRYDIADIEKARAEQDPHDKPVAPLCDKEPDRDSTNPGAYPMKVTFSYLNDKNEVINDEQVITLLVYSLPNLDVSFYRPPDPFFVGQPGALPIQVVNLGKRLSVLGTLKVSAQSGFIENGTSLVGSLDAGGYFTLDSLFTPDQAGPTKLDITIDYVDDFNQPRTITRTLELQVEEVIEVTPDPSQGGGEVVNTEETFGQEVGRFILGLLGLDSAPPSENDSSVPSEQPVEPVPSGGKG